MYTLIQHLRVRDALLTEVASFTVSLVIAELFFKFHSFTLECLAFLVTWLLLSTLASWAWGGRRTTENRFSRKKGARPWRGPLMKSSECCP